MMRNRTYAMTLVAGLALLSGGCAADRLVGVPDGAGSTVRISGTQTYSPSRDGQPLVLVDGRQVQWGDANEINPDRIKQVEILKGDAAVKLYGSAGAHGVVLIQTRGADS